MSPARLGAWFRESMEIIERSAGRGSEVSEHGTGVLLAGEQSRFDRGPWVVCLVGGLCLVLMEYVGSPLMLQRLLELCAPEQLGPDGLFGSRWSPLLQLVWWVNWRLIGFFVLPALAIRWLLKRPIRDFGLAVHDLRISVPLYSGLFLALLPMLGFAATRPEFLNYYPFYSRAGQSWFDLLSWEFLYALHFVALEFFFRGFWLEASRRALGVHAIAFMMVPYCMIHFSKPALEVVAALPAGLILGLLAMRTRSILGGAALHIAVAWTMDLLAITKASGLPRTWWP